MPWLQTTVDSPSANVDNAATLAHYCPIVMRANWGDDDMDIESFRRDGHRLIDWIAEYLAHPERYPVLAQVEPGQVKRALSKEPPEKPEPLEAILQDVEEIIVPG